MARRADDFPNDPAVILANPDDDVTPGLFREWLDRIQQGEPVNPGISAGEILAEIREHGEE